MIIGMQNPAIIDESLAVNHQLADRLQEHRLYVIFI